MKYKLTKKYIDYFGVKLFQIQAVTAFGNVSKGELGGYIQSEQCLSQLGDAWVSGDAWVYGRNSIFWASEVGTENGTLTVSSGRDGLVVTRGCFTGTKEEFLAKSAKVHDEKTEREYRLLIEVAESRIKHHKAPKPTIAAD